MQPNLEPILLMLCHLWGNFQRGCNGGVVLLSKHTTGKPASGWVTGRNFVAELGATQHPSALPSSSWKTLKAVKTSMRSLEHLLQEVSASSNTLLNQITNVLLPAMIEAGSETTSSSLNSAFKYLAAYPEVQQKVHEEISSVIGDERSPTFEDEESLPYVRAAVKEIFRLRPVTSLGSPHYTTEDLIYKDHFIPKGTVVAICQYAAHYDETRYENPDAFQPERYLGHTLKAGAYVAHPDPYQRDHFTFGAGRRICPGLHLAENSMFIVLAKILWAFELKPPLLFDKVEEKLDLSDQAYEPGMNTLPKTYRLRFVPRSPAREAKLLQEWEKAKADGYWLGNLRVNAEGVVDRG